MTCGRTLLPRLGQASAVLVIDETRFPKRGKKSAGVGWQDGGTTGKVEHCQVGVFLWSVTAKGHTRIDREVYLPLDWTLDQERCQAAGIPEAVRFQTKPELAIQMLKRIFQAQLPLAWVVAESVYGGNLDVRTWLEAPGSPYVLAVACDEPVGSVTPDAHRRLMEVREVEALLLQEQEWQRLALSAGTTGPGRFDWAVIPILHQWENDGRHWLLIRRSLTDPHEHADYFVLAPAGTTLQELVQASGARWPMEEDFAQAKEMGLDPSEVRSLLGWYRHVTLGMLALAYLAGMCWEENVPLLGVATPPTAPLTLLVLPLTVPEVRHLLGHLIWPTPRNRPRARACSRWRRCHQRRASYFHTKRRLQAG